MKQDLKQIQKALQCYSLEISDKLIENYLKVLSDAQQYFPIIEQQAIMIKLLNDWEIRRSEKIFTITTEACSGEKGPYVTTFGVLSVDWPGFYDTCSGIIHEMGWNIYFTKGIMLNIKGEDLGIVIIGVRTETDEDHQKILDQSETINEKIKQAAIGTKAKTYLLAEEIRKLEIYSKVIAYIEKVYHGNKLENIIGFNGEAVKYFAARSRDYIENRKIEAIAKQIIRNFNYIGRVQKSGKTIQLNITNFETMTEGTFTGVTVAGPAHMLHLEDCLKTIELTCPNFFLKHNREFTTEEGISLFRIEFVTGSNHPLTRLEIGRLKNSFTTMVLNKRRDRAQWIESIGGFEQYARAIIPLLVKETQATGKPQVYQAVINTTDLFIDFKVIVVVPSTKETRKKIVTKTIDKLESVSNIHILSVKPPKTFGKSDLFIIDLRINITDIDDTESIYSLIRDNIRSAIGDFRDFDQGMRTIDAAKLKSVRQRLEGMNKNLLRELYYSIEDFFRVSADEMEIISHIRITADMLRELDKSRRPLLVLSDQTGTLSSSGQVIPTATLFCLAYAHRLYLLPKILDILEPYEVTLSRLEKHGRDILICRVTLCDKALPPEDAHSLVQKFETVCEKENKKNNHNH